MSFSLSIGSRPNAIPKVDEASFLMKRNDARNESSCNHCWWEILKPSPHLKSLETHWRDERPYASRWPRPWRACRASLNEDWRITLPAAELSEAVLRSNLSAPLTMPKREAGVVTSHTRTGWECIKVKNIDEVVNAALMAIIWKVTALALHFQRAMKPGVETESLKSASLGRIRS